MLRNGTKPERLSHPQSRGWDRSRSTLLQLQTCRQYHLCSQRCHLSFSTRVRTMICSPCTRLFSSNLPTTWRIAPTTRSSAPPHDQTARCSPFNLDSLRCSSEDPGSSGHVRLDEYSAQDVFSR